MIRKKVLVAVSGGPDSIYLLRKIKNSFLYNPVVLHVNYHFRDESNHDQKIVETYCKKYKIEFSILDVTKKLLEKYVHINNLEAKAREIRYDFFKKMSVKYQANILFIGHHRDDFIETAIMQEEKNKELLFYGLRKSSVINNLKVIRPLLTRYKEEIVNKLNKKQISYAVDLTNFDEKYKRNKIRLNLLKYGIKKKEEIFKYFTNLNKINKDKRNKILKIYRKFTESNFDINFFNNIEQKYLIYIMFEYFFNLQMNINLTSDKIKSLIEFLKARNYSKEYLLSENLILKVIDKKIKVIAKF